MVKLSVDFEHVSRTWWEAGGQDLWEGLMERPAGKACFMWSAISMRRWYPCSILSME